MTTHAQDVLAFHEKFGVPMRTSPGMIAYTDIEYKLKHILEEVTEAFEAAGQSDLVTLVDSLVDVVYVAIGAALNLGVNPETWQRCWDLVQAANMAKVRVDRPEQSKRNHPWDIVKPEGWVAPEAKMSEVLFTARFMTMQAKPQDLAQRSLFPEDEQC